SDASGRIGLTWANFWRPLPQLRVDLDASFARARFHELTAGEDRIPGALERVITAGIAWEPLASGPHAALRIRHFGEYPLTEDGSVRAPATSLLELNIGWTRGPFRISASVLNRLDARDADIAYFYCVASARRAARRRRGHALPPRRAATDPAHALLGILSGGAERGPRQRPHGPRSRGVHGLRHGLPAPVARGSAACSITASPRSAPHGSRTRASSAQGSVRRPLRRPAGRPILTPYPR